MLNTKTDEELILRYGQTTETAALEEITQRYYPAAFRTAMHMLGNASCAEDAAQEAFINLIRSASRFEKGRNFQSWWKGILYNSIRKEARKRKNQAKRDQGFAAQNPNIVADNTVDTLIFNEVRDEVLALPVELREAVTLRYFDGHTHQEVASILGCAPGTASSRIRRGLESLQESLGARRFKAASFTLTAVLTQLGQSPAEAQSSVPSAQLLLRGAKAPAGSSALGFQIVMILIGISSLALLIPDSRTPPKGSETAQRSVVTPGPQSGQGQISSKAGSTAKFSVKGENDGDPAKGARSSPASTDRKFKPGSGNAAESSTKPQIGSGLFLIDSSGEPCPNALVRLQKANGLLQRGRPETLFRPGPDLGELRSNKRGFVALPDLPSNTLLTIYSQKGREGLAMGPLPLSEWIGKTISLRDLAKPGDRSAVWVSQIAQAECAGRPAKITIYRKNGRRVFFNDKYRSMVAADGSLVLGDLTPMEAIFVVHIRGFAPFQTKTLSLQRNQVLKTEIDLKPELVVTGRITLPSGIERGDVKVFVRATDDRSRPTVFGELLNGGRYRFSGLSPNKSYVFGAIAHGFATRVLKQSFAEGGEQDGGELALGVGPVIRGQIVTPKGLPHSHLQLRFMNDVSSPEARGYVAVTDDNGYFSLEGIPEGQYRYRYETQTSNSISYDYAFDEKGKRAVARVKGGITHLGKLVYDGSADCILLEGQVFDKNGATVADALIRLDDGFSSENLNSDKDGRYAFRLKRAGTYRLQVRNADFVGIERELKLALGQNKLVDLALVVPAGQIFGQVFAPSQRLTDGLGATIKRLTKKRSLLSGVEFVTCDDKGRFKFLGLEAGRYSLKVGDFQRVLTLEAGQKFEQTIEAKGAKNVVAVSISGLASQSEYKLSSVALSWEKREGLSAGGIWRRVGQQPTQFRYLPSGSLNATIKLKGSSNMLEFSETVQLVDGQRSLQLPIKLESDLGTVEGTFKELRYQWVVLANSRVQASAFIRKDGSFSLKDIPAGSYWIVATNAPQPTLEGIQRKGQELRVKGGSIAKVSSLGYLKE